MKMAKYSTTSTRRIGQAKVSWFDLGPRSPPCLSIILNEERTTKLNLCAVDIPWYGSSEIASPTQTQMHRPIGVLSQIECNLELNDTSILALHQIGAVGCYCAGEVIIYQPTLAFSTGQSFLTAADGYFVSLRRPVSSQSLGLNSDGTVHFNESPTTSRRTKSLIRIHQAKGGVACHSAIGY